MSPLVSPSPEHAVWSKQREAEQHSTYCSGLGTEVLRPSTPMLLLGLLTTWGLGGRTCDMHRDISSDTAPDPTADTDNTGEPPASYRDLLLGLALPFVPQCDPWMWIHQRIWWIQTTRPHNLQMEQIRWSLTAICSALFGAGWISEKGFPEWASPCAASAERKAGNVCVLWTLHWQWGSALIPRPFWLLAPRNPTSQVRTSVQGSTVNCYLG